MNNQEKVLYRIQFINNGKTYQIYVREVLSSSIWGFLEIADFVFDSQTTVVVDPTEEKLKTEFSGVTRSYIPLHSIIRIDSVKEKGSVKISDFDGKVMPFPYFPEKK